MSVVGVKLLWLVNLIQQDQGVDMTFGELKLARPWSGVAGFVGLLFLTGLLFRCGSDNKKKDAPTENPSPGIPSDWDGKSDWSGSAWKVTTE